MTEKKVKFILEKEKKQKPKEIKFELKRVWDFEGIIDAELDSLIKELIKRADIEKIMNYLACNLIITGKENNVFWADQIRIIKDKKAE